MSARDKTPPVATSAAKLSYPDLDNIVDAFKAEADADRLMPAGGMERLTAFDYFKRGWMRGCSVASSAIDSGMQPAGAPDVIRHEHCYVWSPAVDAPEVRSVLVWDYERELPHAAILDPDQNCWISLHDCTRIEGVREWMHYAVPAEELTGPDRLHTTLSPEEEDLVRAYRESDDRARGMTLGMALYHREHYPRDFSAMPPKIKELKQGVSALAEESE